MTAGSASVERELDSVEPPLSSDGGQFGTRRHSYLWTVVLALLVVGWIEGALWTLTRVFILNFDIAGPNQTILLAFLLATGWILLPVARAGPDQRLVYAGSGLGAVAGFLGSLASDPMWAGLGAILLITAVTPPIVGLADALREYTVYGVGLGILLVVGLRVGLNTASPYATPGGILVFGTVILSSAVLLLVLAARSMVPETEWNQMGPFPAVPCTLLVVSAGFLAHPHAVARWALRPYSLSVLALVVGIATGLGWFHVRGAPAGVSLLGWLCVSLASVAVIVFLSHTLATIGYALAWTSAIVMLPAAAQATSRGSGAGAVAGFQLLAVVVLSLSVVATHWAFMPYPLDQTRGLAPELTLVFLATYPLAVGVVSGTASTTGKDARVRPLEERRALLTTLVAGFLPLGSAFSGGSPLRGNASAEEGPPEERVRVMAYNLHVFFEGEETGQYSLRALRDVIADDGADIVGVCESDGLRPLPGFVDGLRWLGDELDYHAVFGAPTRSRSYGVGILSRWPMEDVRVIELPIGRSITRLAVLATVQTPTGPLPVASTHFMVGNEDASLDTRDEQAETIVDALSDHERGVVMGDFNFTPEEPEYEILNDAFTDAWTAAEHRLTSGETYSASEPRKRIDYVFLKGEWAVHEATTTGSSRASDHLAVAAEIEPSASGNV